MVRKILCVMIAAALSMVLMCSCSLDFLKGKTTENADEMPVIELPNLPASVSAYGGKVLVQSITFDGKYNKTQKSMNATVSLMIENGADGSTGMCLVDFNILDESGVIVDSGNLGSGEMMDIGSHYEGKFYVMSVEAGKKYKLKFIES